MPLPALRSEVFIPAAALADSMNTVPTCSIKDGVGDVVLMRTVNGSIASTEASPRTARRYGAGEFATVLTRCNENTTSAAVNLLPSWKLTSGRSLISHVVGSTTRHEAASAGKVWFCASVVTRPSNMSSAVSMLTPVLANCGSSEDCSPARPIARSAAWAGNARIHARRSQRIPSGYIASGRCP